MITTERDTETETDGYEFRWSRMWRERALDGGERDYCETFSRAGTEKLAEARTAHTHDLHGQWVKFGMLDPHVSALRVIEKGRPLAEELAPAKDLDEVATQDRFV